MSSIEGAKRVATPLAQVLKIDFTTAAPPVKLPKQYSDVELTDGSQFHCKEFSIKDKQVELKTLAGQDIKLPLSAIANILINAGNEKYRKDWIERLGKKRRRDVVAILNDGAINPVEGTLGVADADGKTIEFQAVSGKRRDLSSPTCTASSSSVNSIPRRRRCCAS